MGANGKLIPAWGRRRQTVCFAHHNFEFDFFLAAVATPIIGRVGKNPGFFKKKPAQWVFLVFLGFFGVFWVFLGFFWVFLGFFAQTRGF